MNVEIETARAPDEWALNICKALGGVSEYWNPPGEMTFFDRQKHENCNIQLKLHHVKISACDQGWPAFEPNLSIIDVIMFVPPEKINVMMDKYELL